MTESAAKQLEAPEEDSQDKDLLTKKNYKDNLKLKQGENGNYVLVNNSKEVSGSKKLFQTWWKGFSQG